MSKERIENITTDIEVNCVKKYDFVTTINYEDALWLIKQAKQSVEREEGFFGRLAAKNNIQKKRYREAMNEASRIAKSLSCPACSDIEVIISKALEETK